MRDYLLYILMTGVFLGLALFFIFSNRFSISKIEVARDDLHTDSSIILEELSDYKGKSILTFSGRRAEHRIKKAFPEFSAVRIRKVWPNALTIELETHEIVANLRAYYVLPEIETSPLLEEEEFALDFAEELEAVFDLEREEEEEEGVEPVEQKALLNRVGQAIFDREEDIELMTIIVEGLTQPVEDREIIIPKEAMDFTFDSIKYLQNELGLEVAGVRFLPVAREVHLRTEAGTYLWLSTGKDYRKQIDNLALIYRAAELDKEDLAYIDLRIREKIIYCPRRTSCDR
ncbi:MAG: FtsQ-type POTRA domain-containing protein [Candidatus Peregrinibacteria bacterium]|nr:FtsQ-type POTRA domain-containing protein [Candidatus Peregrinibacteria bacterium]